MRNVERLALFIMCQKKKTKSKHIWTLYSGTKTGNFIDTYLFKSRYANTLCFRNINILLFRLLRILRSAEFCWTSVHCATGMRLHAKFLSGSLYLSFKYKILSVLIHVIMKHGLIQIYSTRSTMQTCTDKLYWIY